MPDDVQGTPATPRLPVRAFINYASDDRELAEWLYRRLLEEGAIAVWLDRQEIEGGDAWKKEIDDGLWQSQVAIAILTRTSADPQREWIHYEQERAFRLLKTVIPCLFEEDESAFIKEGLLPERLNPINVISFTDRDEGFLELANAIGKRLPRYGQEFQNQARGVTHSFVGREHDLLALKSHIDEESSAVQAGVRTIAIQGMGGLGKTMLAEELVRRLAFHYPGGVVMESRAGQKVAARLVMERWVEWALDEPPKREYKPNEVRHLLATRYGAMLFLLDDIAAEDTVEAKELLDAMPPDAVRLVTTRSEEVAQRLGAVIYRLEPLNESDALELLRVRLHERFSFGAGADARAEVDTAIEENLDSLELLARKVDHHPLALDLGIGTCDSLASIPETVEKLTASLERSVERFRLGVSTLSVAMDAADRNTSLAHSLEISLDELEKLDARSRPGGWRAVLSALPGRRAGDGRVWTSRFRALGIFPDGCRMSRRMILAVWGDDTDSEDQALDALSGFTRRALLRIDRASGYYYNHPVVRAYATGLLMEHPKQYQAVRRRYVRYVIERAAAEFARPQEEWKIVWLLLPHMQRVAEILRSALGLPGQDLEDLGQPSVRNRDALRALKRAAEIDLRRGIEFAHAVEEYVVRRPEWGEVGRRCLRLGLACSRAANRQADEVEFLKRLGGSHSRGQPELAGNYFTQALELAREIGDTAQEASILSYYGELERVRGEWDHALELLNAALELHRTRQDALMEATTLKYTGETYWRMSQLDEASECYREALEIFAEHDFLAGVADILNKMGAVEFNRGEHRQAIKLFERALELHQQVGNRSMEAEDLNDMGAAYRYLGELDAALERFKQALDIHLRLGNRRLESITRANMAGTLWAQRIHERAHREAEHALRIAEEVEARIAAVWSLSWAGLAFRDLGEIDKAEDRFRDAVDRARRANNPRGLAGVLGNLAALLLEHRQNPGEARDLLREALGVMQKHDLQQAFGGRRLEEFRELLSRAEG